MFPNPQDIVPLPTHPSLERYKKIAKELVKACKSGAPESISALVDGWVESLVKLSALNIPESSTQIQRWTDEIDRFARQRLLSDETGVRKCALADAQFVIARSHGFESWPKFVSHLESTTEKDSAISKFEAAAEAIVRGDAETLKRLLREDPDLVHRRSTREHAATLLHYTSANGVEHYRQKTPKNIVEIAEMLLHAGAEIDATANVYGSGCTTLGLAATSVFPELAGVQEELLQTLLDHGAALEGQAIAGNTQSIIIACLGNGRPKAAEFLADHGARLDLSAATALGRIEVVKTFFHEDNRLKANATPEQLNEGFRYACEFGHKSTVEFLLPRGADLQASGRDGQTALHFAVIGGQIEIVKLLLPHRPPLEAKNMYDGTALEQSLWSAAHGGDPETYVGIIEALIAAGAKVPTHHVPVHARVDEVLAQYGSKAEPSWYWFGEKPRSKKS